MIVTDWADVDVGVAIEWARKQDTEALIDSTGECRDLWLGNRPGFPTLVLIDDGLVVWDEAGLAEIEGAGALLSDWATARKIDWDDGDETSRLGGVQFCGDGLADMESVAAMTRKGLWVVTVGPRETVGSRQRRDLLRRCKRSDGQDVSALNIVPRTAEGPGHESSRSGGATHQETWALCDGADLERLAWYPYTEIWMDGKVVFTEQQQTSSRHIVMAVVIAVKTMRVEEG